MEPTSDPIARAFQLAEESASVDEIRFKLKKEGFSNVDAHLMGPQIRSALTKVIRRDPHQGSEAGGLTPTSSA